ncbi:type II toxin-antitoxin system HicA family toxin [Pleurocapsa sp. PCC 7319]|uniref:type II toxin-antitoxin system HicA family toxin n=1 Tax=Pleurocapsa sp. PCC 7319 TaxID=118161 RepID=UPI00036C3AEB|nr:type II toxin-antitoxin system HicA family toxin [Pleurocapsa sp. PCC 7319]
MPKKIRELKAILLKAGFELMPKRGKGSHAIYQYPGTTIRVNLPGKDGSDAKAYSEKQVKQAIERANNES